MSRILRRYQASQGVSKSSRPGSVISWLPRYGFFDTVSSEFLRYGSFESGIGVASLILRGTPHFRVFPYLFRLLWLATASRTSRRLASLGCLLQNFDFLLKPPLTPFLFHDARVLEDDFLEDDSSLKSRFGRAVWVAVFAVFFAGSFFTRLHPEQSR